MNKHTRLLVIVLFAILIVLASAIIVFYLDVNKSSAGSSAAPLIATEYAGNSEGSCIFQDANGNYGLTDANGNIILEAEWTELSGIGNRCFAAKLVTGSQTLTGIIDKEGNVVVPFAYESMERLTDFLYAGKHAADGKYFFYDADFRLLLPEAWDDYSLIDETLHLEKDGDAFVYGLGASLELIEIDLPRRIRPVSFSLKVRDTQLLRKMERSDWCHIADLLLTYLDAYRREQLEKLENITISSRLTQVKTNSDTCFRWKGGTIDPIEVVVPEGAEGLMLQCRMELSVPVQEENAEAEEEKCVELLLTFSPDEDGDWRLWNAEFSE